MSLNQRTGGGRREGLQPPPQLLETMVRCASQPPSQLASTDTHNGERHEQRPARSRVQPRAVSLASNRALTSLSLPLFSQYSKCAAGGVWLLHYHDGSRN